MYVYKSLTGRTVNIGSFVITADPGLQLSKESEKLDALVGTVLCKFVDGVASKPILDGTVPPTKPTKDSTTKPVSK